MTETETAPPGFEETYREHRLALVRLAFLMCGSRDMSEDLVQSAFASAHPRWREIDNHVAYLRRAVVNLAKDGQRKHFRRLRLAPPPDPDPVTASLNSTRPGRSSSASPQHSAPSSSCTTTKTSRWSR